MDMRKAAAETLQAACAAGMDQVSSDIPELDYPHLVEMYNKLCVYHGEEEEFSEAKLGRWLGWMQAAVVAAQVGLTLEDMKQINKRNA